jgi:Zn-dependent protease with chaperone function
VTAASLIAFALVFLAVSVLVSLFLGIGLRCAGRRLRAVGARAEQRAATLALAGPPALGFAVVAFLAANSGRSLLAGTDHCLAHPHHLHLCLLHGAAWMTRPWAVALIAVVLCFVTLRFLQILWAHVDAQRAAWRFRRMGEPLPEADRCVLIPLSDTMVFTAGAVSPTVVISEGAWNGLGPAERRAVIAHELEHVANGDLWRRAVLAFFACFAAPGFAASALRLWDRSAERICDRRAVDVVGQSTVVASAIVALARGMSRGRAPACAVFAAACSITERVHSLLDAEPDGGHGAARLLRWSLVVGVGIAVASAAYSEQLHHLLETILG